MRHFLPSSVSTIFILCLSCYAIGSAHTLSAQITTGTLLDELSDRDQLAVYPASRYKQGQVSSHDTRNALSYSRLGAPWGSVNVDFGNYLRSIEVDGRTEHVLMDEEGPGVLTRWWTTGLSQALIDSHHFRIYIDGADKPVIEASAEDLIGGNNSGFGDGLNFFTPNRGGNLYAPIPYQKSVMITWDGPLTHDAPNVALRDPELKNSVANALWYNINFRELPEGTDVKSYTDADKAAYQANLDHANKVLAELVPTGSVTNQQKENKTLASGDTLSVRLEGTGAIRRVQVKVTGQDQVAALKDAHLVLVFDGKQTAKIPVGEFFGNGYSDSPDKPYNVGADYMRSVAADGTMLSLWVMPYEKSAEVRIENASGQSIEASLQVDAGEWVWNDRSMYFHADYVSEPGILTRQKPGGPWPGDAAKRELYSAEGDGDFRFIDIRGRGVFVGDTMSIRNKSTGGGLNSWWGEGDEKIYIDYLDDKGDGSTTKPVHLGTGTEDYYGYSFGSGKEFVTPFVTQPNAAGNRRDDGSLTIQGRVRGLDAIPFDQSFKFDMEIWKWRQGELDLGAATFWYGVPGAVSLHPVANLALDFTSPKLGPLGEEPIKDTAGDGQWQYLSSDHANPSAGGAVVRSLSWGVVGNQNNNGYGGAENGENNLPAISNQFIYETGTKNIGTQGKPGYHELHVHPAGSENFGGSNANRPYLVSRWIAGPSSEGLVNIAGSVRNLADQGDSVDFYLYVNGELKKQAVGNEKGDGLLPEFYFDFDVDVKAGDTVDFVLGNGGNGQPYHDESAIRVVIRSANKKSRSLSIRPEADDSSSPQIDFESLLDEMIDRDALAKAPVYPFLLKQASSYDRASKTPDQPGWYANKDGDGFIRTEVNQGRTERVLMEAQGPGAVVRFWSTFLTWKFSNGTLRFYFDGSDTPQIEGKFHDIIHGTYLANGTLAQTTGGFLENEHTLAGRNLYLPIPYAKGCKITYEGNDSPFYFAINYREYAEGVRVQTFSMSDLKRHRTKLEAVQQELVNNTPVSRDTKRLLVDAKTIEPGQSVSFVKLEGSRAIRQIALQLDAADHRQAMRSTVIEIKFDGNQTVWAPIGDFFGTGYRLSPFESRYHKVTIDGRLLCRWVMPFKDAAEITIHNHGKQPVAINQFEACHSGWEWGDRSLYFHAAWRLYPEAPTARGRDTNYITLRGQGHYVGDSLTIFNAASGEEGQPWWGEGDEKIYIDGEPFPSHFGTGTEDYYGYAWVGCTPFGVPFLSQPIAQGNRGRGLTVNGRWRVLDTMPFEQSLKLDMEIWSWVGGITVDYAPTTFWYGTADTRPVVDLDANPISPLPNDVQGAKRTVRTVERTDAEGMQIKMVESGKSFVHTAPNDRRLSNRSYWMVRSMKPGDQAVASFFSANEQTGKLEVALVKTPLSTTIDLLLNGKMITKEIDLRSEGFETFIHTIPQATFIQGGNEFAVRVSDGKKAGEFGVDYLVIYQH